MNDILMRRYECNIYFVCFEEKISHSDRNVEYDNSSNEDSDFNLDDVVEGNLI